MIIVSRPETPGLERNHYLCPWCHQHGERVCHECLISLVALALQTYTTAINDRDHVASLLLPTDRHPADDLIMLAAMCFVKFSGLLPVTDKKYTRDLHDGYLMRAAALLEHAWAHSKANSDISLVLVRLYSLIGAGSLAFRAYQRLNLKQIQQDTLGYTLFDRISILHPHSVQSELTGLSDGSPTKSLEKMQNFYKAAREKTRSSAVEAFMNGAYVPMMEMLQVSKHLDSSISMAMSAIELRRISRKLTPSAHIDDTTHGYNLLRMVNLETTILLLTHLCSQKPRDGHRFLQQNRQSIFSQLRT